jgi:hypothetical protein
MMRGATAPQHNFAAGSGAGDGDMCHGCSWCSAVPMLHAWRKPNHVTGSNLFDRATLYLRPAAASYNNKCLTERMRVPRCASTRLESDASG